MAVRLHWRIALISVAIITIISIALAKLFQLPVWIIFIVVVLAILLNGWIATIEDEAPGGFNNPKK